MKKDVKNMSNMSNLMFFSNFDRFGGQILVFFGILGVIFGAILEPEGRLGPMMDPLKKQTLKKSPAAFTFGSFWGRFGLHFGLIFGVVSASIFGPRFWRPFGTLFGHFWARFGTKRALKINKKR